MKFTLISHACLLIESGGDSLLIDPWILGSCYWRSWWHFPPARPELVDPQKISAIYLTHEHPDHLHYPSLRRFPRDTRILVPRFPVDRMAGQIQNRGFSRVEQVPHAGGAQIGALRLFSYQAGQDDSIAIITDGETTMFNMNDAKASGLALRYILRRHGAIDFFLRSHAPAQAFPFCYTAEEKKDLELLSRSYYLRLFSSATRIIAPRVAIPFASSVCHLHKESSDQNAHLISPDEVVEECRDDVGGARLVAMSPGDSWESGKGFSLAERVGPEERAAWIRRIAEEKKDVLEKAMAEEAAGGPVSFEAFRAYLEGFLRSVPWPLRRAFPARLAFQLPGEHYVVDLKARRVERMSSCPQDIHATVVVNPFLMRDAIDKAGLNLVGISRRIRVQLKRGGATCDAAFWGLLTLYELGYLPLRNVLNWRGLSGLVVRWRELIGYVPALLSPSRSLEMIIESKTPK